MDTEQAWEQFDALYKTLHRYGRRIEELETRVEALTRELRGRDVERQPASVINIDSYPRRILLDGKTGPAFDDARRCEEIGKGA